MCNDYYEDIYSKHLDASVDSGLKPLLKRGLRWLPWVGRGYAGSAEKILLVGESHYADDQDSTKVNGKIADVSKNERYTREVVAECPINADWPNKTYDNIPRMLLATSLTDKGKRGRLWEQIAFYNFVQRVVNYSNDERPSDDDFYDGWRVYKLLVEALRPKVCIFLGVQASNSFNRAMTDMGLSHGEIQWGEPLNGVYRRNGGSVTLNGDTIATHFVKHPSRFFRWKDWNRYLHNTIPTQMVGLNATVLGTRGFVQEDSAEEIGAVVPVVTAKTRGIPTHLSHKPIIACNYSNIIDSEDTKYLSIGRAQYDQQSASVKAFRHSGTRWSRQSEEVPIHRLGYMMQLLLSAIRLSQTDGPPLQTALREEIIYAEELGFLRAEFHASREELIKSIKAIKALIDGIDLEKI